MRIHTHNPQETFRLLQEVDWKNHPMGTMDKWDSVLIQSLNFIFNSHQPSFIFWSHDAYCFYNDGYIPILGKSKHPASLGAPANDVWKEIWSVDTNPQFVSAMKGNPTWNVDRMVPIERDGKIHEAFFTYGYSPLFDEAGTVKGVIVTALETTSTVVAKRHIDQTAEQLSRALEVLGIGFFDWDITNNIVIFNKKMKEDWGINDDAPLSEAINYVHSDDQESVIMKIQKAIETKSKYTNKYRIIRDGKIEWIDARGLVSYENDKAIRFFGTSIVITEEVLNDEKIKNATDELLNEKHIRETFVSAMTHDLRTPLTAAKMSAQLLMRMDDPLKKQQYLNRIVNNMNRADEMIRDLLDANRMKAGEIIPVERRPLELNTTVSTIVHENASIHGDRFRFIGTNDINGEWDEIALTRIIENLLSNALKYGDPAAPIIVSIKRGPKMAELSVENRGSIISPEDQIKIFHPYHRTHDAHKSRQKGWGIGLSLVRALSEAHGGSAHVESNEESGTKFTICLPIS